MSTLIKSRRGDTAELLRIYSGNRDPKILDELTKSFQPLVRFLANKFVGKGEPIEDLVSLGNIGLINAIERFDPNRGVKFTSYAMPTIVGEIKRNFRDKSWTIKVPRRIQEINLRLSKITETLSQRLSRKPTLLELADALTVGEDDVVSAQQLDTAYLPDSLDAYPFPLLEYLGRSDCETAAIIEFAPLAAALAKLQIRLRRIIHLRFYEHCSQREVARRLGLSQMHVSRLQKEALEALKAFLRETRDSE